MTSPDPKPLGQGLLFRAAGRDRSGLTFGVLVDTAGVQHHLVIGEDGRSSLALARPSGKEPMFLYESTANVLCGGAPNRDGSISYQGASYRIEVARDGNRPIARVLGD